MYVAMTRAERNLYVTAEKGNASTFFTELEIQKTEIDESPKVAENEERGREIFRV